MATLVELSARTVAEAITSLPLEEATRPQRLVVSGGGTRNPVLMARLAALTGLPVLTSDELGLPSQAKEAVLMALLGWLAVHGQPGIVTSQLPADRPGVDGAASAPVTGARAPRVLGSLTPPTPLAIHTLPSITRLVIAREDQP